MLRDLRVAGRAEGRQISSTCDPAHVQDSKGEDAETAEEAGRKCGRSVVFVPESAPK